MRRHAGRLAHRLARIRRWQAALVQRVARLVQHAEQALGEIRHVVARGDPHVARRAAAERVRRAIKPGVGVVEPGPLGQAATQCLLHRGRERPRRPHRRRRERLALLGLRQRPLQERLVVGEHGRHVGHADAALIAVHQRVVLAHAECRCQRGGGLAGQAHHFREVLADQGKIRSSPRLAPDLLAGRVGPGLGFHEVGRQRGRPRVRVAHQAKIGRPPRIVACQLRFRPIQFFHRLGRDQQPVREAGEHRELIAPRGGAAGRHHRGGVPAQHRVGLADGGDAGEAGGQTVVGGIHARITLLAQTANTTSSAAARPNQVMA